MHQQLTITHCDDPRAMLVRCRIADLEREAAMDHLARLARRTRTPDCLHPPTRLPSVGKRLQAMVWNRAVGALRTRDAPLAR
jgi:hypothetical protein